MKVVNNFHPEYVKDGYVFAGFGKLVHEIDQSGGYEEDEAKLFKRGRLYTYLNATGCSCWDGDWEGWADMTKSELRRLADSWFEKGYGSEKAMGAWVRDNV